jgi:phosphoribosylglycinamide formyltransferase 1
MTARLVVLISGNGTNLQALLDACASGELPASIEAVVSNKGAAFGLTRARNSSVPAIHLPMLHGETRQDYDTRLAALALQYHPDYVILAGWMRMLTTAFLDRFPLRVINLHPALPGTFPGAYAIERAYNAWQRGQITRTGLMVHLVPDEGIDNGPVLASREMLFHHEETLDEFEARMHTAEHELLVQAIRDHINQQQ